MNLFDLYGNFVYNLFGGGGKGSVAKKKNYKIKLQN